MRKRSWGLLGLSVACCFALIGSLTYLMPQDRVAGGKIVLPEGSSRTGIFIFDTRYIVDNGSYLTNDVCHIALRKTVSLIPDNTSVLCFYRELNQTNAEDWVQFEPVLTIADFPHDYYLENATNYDVTVSTDYVPPSPEVTNLLFQTSAKICLGWIGTDTLPLVVPGTHLESVNNGETTKGGALYNAVKKAEQPEQPKPVEEN